MCSLCRDWGAAAPAGQLSAVGWNLKCPLDPSLSWIGANVNADPEWTQEENAATFRPVGRKYPVVVSMSLGGADGSMTLSARTDAEWAKLEALRELCRHAPPGVAARLGALHPHPQPLVDGDRGQGRRASQARLLVPRGGRALMYPVSDAFREAVVASDQRAVVTAVVVLDDSELGDLPQVGGTVDVDGTRDGALRTLTLTVSPHPDAFDWLTAAGAEIVVHRGLVLPDGTSELVPLGVFVLDGDLEEAEDGTLTVAAGDRSRRISRARWSDPYMVAAGTNVGAAISDLLHDRWPDCPIGASIATIDKATGARLTYLDGSDSDPWKDARALAASAGLDLYFDGAGEAQVRDTPDPESDPACFTYDAGDKAVVLGQTRKAMLTQQYNGVIVTAEGSGVATPKRGEAWDEDPNSPTYVDGPMGRVPMFYSSPLLSSQDEVDSAAETMLARVKRPIEQTAFTLLPNPAHEAFDVVEFTQADDVVRRYMLDVVSIPLDSAGALTATAREAMVT